MKRFSMRFLLFLTIGLLSFSIAALAAGSYYLDGSVTSQPQFLSDTDISAVDEPGVEVENAGILFMSSSAVTQTGSADCTILAESGSTISLSDVQVDNDAAGANGIFATGPGSVIKLDNVSLECSDVSARGLYTKDNGVIIANNVNVETWKGGGGAAVATSGEYGGTIEVNGGTITTHAGMGSAAVFSTGHITVNNAVMTAEVAEGAVVDGPSSITLNNSVLSALANCGVAVSKSPFSFEPDGTSSVTINGGELTSYGPLFYVPNSYAVIKVQKARLTSESGELINTILPGGGPGSDPSRPAKVEFTAANQFLEGDVICGDDVTITLKLGRRTMLKGAINNSDASGARVIIEMDKASKWKVTADSYITVLSPVRHHRFNIYCPKGITVYYDSDSNEWLGGKIYKLRGGGSLTPF